MRMDSERDFIARLKRREQDAFEQLYRETGDMIHHYIRYRVNGDTGIADDIHSEVFCDAIDYASSLTFEHNVTAWLFRIARSKIANYFRSIAKKQKWEAMKPLDNMKLKAKTQSPEFALLFKEHKLLVHSAFSRLGKEYQLVIRKKYLDNWSLKEIAAFTGKSKKAVESLLFRAREQFQKLLCKLAKERIYRKKE
jgi:RNA polymerase sigma factor (sigma-70 family)